MALYTTDLLILGIRASRIYGRNLCGESRA